MRNTYVDVNSCKGCAFWKPDELNPGFGTCRLHAPQLIDCRWLDQMDYSNKGSAYWPVTREDDWCADGRQKC